MVFRRNLLQILGGAILAVTVTFGLAACAAQPDDVSLPPTHSAEERGLFIADCLNEKGFPTTVQEDGSLLSESPADQQNQRQEAGSECMDNALELYPMPVETEEFKRALYAEELEAVDCLESQGVLPESVPSLQTYIETFSGAERWSAWAHVTPDSQPELFAGDLEELRVLEAACPNPLSLY